MFGGFFGRGGGDSSKPETGGDGRREDGISFGYSLMRGKRPAMEDYFQAKLAKEKYNGQSVALFGVFDGHGGPGAADYVRTHLFPNLLASSRFPADVHGAMSEVFKATDAAYLASDVGYGRDDGCTATVACVIGKVGAGRLIVANVGDSRAVLCRDGRAVPLSIDHKPNRSDERQRIESAGGVVVWAGTWRVGGVLAVSRAFGDRLLKRYVVAEPEIKDDALGPGDEFLLLASDGLWDVLPNQDAVNHVRSMTNPEEMARALTEEAYRRGSVDNITCLAVRFRPVDAPVVPPPSVAAANSPGKSQGAKAAPQSPPPTAQFLPQSPPSPGPQPVYAVAGPPSNVRMTYVG